MLERASVSELKTQKILKSSGHIAVCMRLYPRFLSKDLIDEYVPSLSPAADLFEKYRAYKKQHGGQNQAFQLAGYEEHFSLSPEGMSELARLSEKSRSENVYLVCQCHRHEYCHVDLMLLLAERHYQARIGKLPYDYSEFRARL